MNKVFAFLLIICISSSLHAQNENRISPAYVFKTNLAAPVSLIGEIQFKNNFAAQLQFQYLYLYQPIGEQHYYFGRITGEARYFLTPRDYRTNIPYYYLGLYTRSKYFMLSHLSNLGSGYFSTGTFAYSYVGQVFGFTGGLDMDAENFMKGINFDLFIGGGYMPIMKKITDTDRRIDIDDPMNVERFEFRLGFCIGLKSYL